MINILGISLKFDCFNVTFGGLVDVGTMNRKVKNVSTLNYSQSGFKDFKMGKMMVLCRIHLGESRVGFI